MSRSSWSCLELLGSLRPQNALLGCFVPDVHMHSRASRLIDTVVVGIVSNTRWIFGNALVGSS